MGRHPDLINIASEEKSRLRGMECCPRLQFLHAPYPQPLRNPHQVRQRAGPHLMRNLAAMNLNRELAYPPVRRLFVYRAVRRPPAPSPPARAALEIHTGRATP